MSVGHKGWWKPLHFVYVPCSWQAEKDVPHDDVRLVAPVPPDVQFHVDSEVEVTNTVSVFIII